MNNMNRNVIVYGIGSFYKHHKCEICSQFNICGYIDMNGCIKQMDGFNVAHNISEVRMGEYIDAKILIMVEKPEFIFDIFTALRANLISTKSILLGVSYYGVLSKYYNISVTDDWKLAINTECWTEIVSDADGFYKSVKANALHIFDQRGKVHKNALYEIYKDQLEIMWMDGDLWCANHDIDIYYRFVDTGFYNWSYALAFSMIALNHFDNPNVLELGCGDAYWFKSIYKNVEGIRYTGCDISEELIRNNCIIFSEQANVKFFICDISSEMSEVGLDATYDVVLWMESYCVFTDKQHDLILTEVKKRLGINGLIFLCDFFSSARKSPWKYSINSVNNKQKLKEDFSRFFNNVSVFCDEKAEFFCLFASDGSLPLNF